MKKRKYFKQQEKFINQIIDILENNQDYQKYKETDKHYKEIIERDNQLSVWGITFFDIYDNKGINKLVKDISKLNNKKYKVDLTLRAKRFTNLNYLKLQYDYTSTYLIANVDFIDDKFINKITASFSQINNNQAIVDFEIDFKKIMDSGMQLEFIKDNKVNLYKKDFVSVNNLDRMIETKSFSDIYGILQVLIKSTFQAKLMEIVNLNIGQKFKLPSCMVFQYPKELFNKEIFKNVFLKKTYEICDGKQYLIIDKTLDEGLEMELYFSEESYIALPFTSLIRDYRMDFYYFLFDRIERFILNQKMNKYFNESKNRISSKDYKWLVNKIRAINDNKLHRNYEKVSSEELKEWKVFYDGEESKLDFIDNNYINKYETIYKECLEHIKIIYNLQKEKLIINIAALTLLATIIGIGTTILLSA